MSQKLEDFIPVIKYHGVNTDKDVDLDGTLNVEGAATFQGAASIAGAMTLSGAVTMSQAPTLSSGVKLTATSLTPDDSEGAGVNVIPAGVTSVRLGANVNGVNDFVVLPALADVPDGHEITIIAGAADCEVRTPATSGEEINSEDCDGTKEYLLTATEVHKFIKIDDTIGWMGHGYSAIGAVVTAVVPD